jgi:methionyl aminopeptidase
MSIESAADWKGMRRAGRVAYLTLEALEPRVTPGTSTAELDAVAAAVFATHGARSAPAMVYGFPGTVLISVNDEVVHGVPGPKRLESGDVVKLDVTVEKDGYVADAARTVIIGSGSEIAQRLAACAKAAFELALDVAKVGR